MLRPRATTWFELLTGRDQFALAMQTLASTGAAELEAKPLPGSAPVLPRLDDFFEAFAALESKYGPWWPSARGHGGMVVENPIALTMVTQARLEDWARRADPIVADLRREETRLSELDLVARLVATVPPDTPLHRLTEAEAHALDHAIWFLPQDADSPRLPASVLTETFASETGSFLIALSRTEDRTTIEAALASARATPVPLPDFLVGSTTGHAEQVARHIAETSARRDAARARLDALAEATGLSGLLSRVAVLDWLRGTVGDIRATRHMMRVTGWTASPGGAALSEALDAAGVDYVLTLGEGAPDNPPMILDNPGWARAFEFFPRLLGVPASGEIDPSVITALVAPILFGFMFGDVGQGAVLVVAGLTLRRRLPIFALFVPGGIAAMVFGLLFGSIFSLEDVIPALWLHPIHAPITVLGVALGFGAFLLLLGVLLDVAEARAHRRTGHWLSESGGAAIAWLGLFASFAWAPAAWIALAGLFLALGAARQDDHWTPAAAGKSAAEFVETLMRLLVSTVSFARVGAFALAHAGLSAAIVGIAEALGGVGFWIALFFGNALILALEGLVTGIQTTRLILFEFYIRFFRAEGRSFVPLAAPSLTAKSVAIVAKEPAHET